MGKARTILKIPHRRDWGEDRMKPVLAASVRTWTLLMTLSLSGAVVTAPAAAQTPVPIPHLDMDKFTGTWYAVARLPEKRDKKCERNAILMVALGDKPRSVQLLNSCQNKRGWTLARNTNGKADDNTGDGKLKFRTIWPFYRKDWVLAVDPQYTWALLGSPNHKNLFILSRTPILPLEVLAELKAKAATQGFPIDKLIMQPEEAKYKAD